MLSDFFPGTDEIRRQLYVAMTRAETGLTWSMEEYMIAMEMRL